jgi:hypothetical protein
MLKLLTYADVCCMQLLEKLRAGSTAGKGFFSK